MLMLRYRQKKTLWYGQTKKNMLMLRYRQTKSILMLRYRQTKTNRFWCKVTLLQGCLKGWKESGD
jgi:hypothetical protein